MSIWKILLLIYLVGCLVTAIYECVCLFRKKEYDMNIRKFNALLICVLMSWVTFCILETRRILQKRKKKDIFETEFNIFNYE